MLLAGLESPTDHPTVLLIKEGSVRTCSQKCNRKEPLEPDHLKGLARQTNFEDLLQLRSLVMYVLSYVKDSLSSRLNVSKSLGL